MANPLEIHQNSLLRRLSASDLDLLQTLTPVELTLRQVLEVADAPSEFVYFIETGLASVTSSAMASGETEIGLIGRDGMSGLGLAYGDRQPPFQTYMQIKGSAQRCEAGQFSAALLASPTLNALVLTYARAFSIQVGETAVANGRAKLEERLARWLLMVSDRQGNSFDITHEFMAIMLAVRRSGVTLAVQNLEGRGLIRATRGTIRILDRDGLIDTSGGAYGLAEREYTRLLGAMA